VALTRKSAFCRAKGKRANGEQLTDTDDDHDLEKTGDVSTQVSRSELSDVGRADGRGDLSNEKERIDSAQTVA
jgi:hypothetical protein